MKLLCVNFLLKDENWCAFIKKRKRKKERSVKIIFLKSSRNVWFCLAEYLATKPIDWNANKYNEGQFGMLMVICSKTTGRVTLNPKIDLKSL